MVILVVGHDVIHRILVLYALLVLVSSTTEAFTIEEKMVRESFHKTFHHKCSKYPFVERYWANLDHPADSFVEFVYQEAGLKNGGFGDRLGGLITATAIALRFNRTLLIKSGNGFGEYFRPFNRPTQSEMLHEMDGARNHYSYLNYSQWTAYNASLSNSDETELDLWNCINMNGKQNDYCGLDWTESVKQSIIKLRSNRCYLCKWMVQGRPASQQIRNILGIDESSNLYEVGGCLLRLAMWPTDFLFSKLGELLKMELNPLVGSYDEALMLQSTQESRVPEVNAINIHHLHSHRHHHFTMHQHHLPILIGVHFRCGDWGYIKGRSYDTTCKHDPTKNASDYKQLGESDYMRFGTPVDIGRCAREIISNISQSFSDFQLTSPSVASTNIPRRLLELANSLNVVLHVASDNPGSAAQMKEYADFNRSFTSPFGCHVDRDATRECTETTITYWMLLAMSDFIVTQVENGRPISGFSRFAGIYGLKGDSFVTAIGCELSSFQQMGWQASGNWVCG
jgi:hypothetical protein